jgi:hypothetical protein
VYREAIHAKLHASLFLLASTPLVPGQAESVVPLSRSTAVFHEVLLQTEVGVQVLCCCWIVCDKLKGNKKGKSPNSELATKLQCTKTIRMAAGLYFPSYL